jgi:hypothetical protein
VTYQVFLDEDGLFGLQVKIPGSRAEQIRSSGASTVAARVARLLRADHLATGPLQGGMLD